MLVKSVLGNLPTYFLSLFVAPSGVLDTLEKIKRYFLWGRSEGKSKRHCVAWDKVTTAKVVGGLGVGSIKSLNISLIINWWWRLRSDPSLLWDREIIAMHNVLGKPNHVYSKKSLVVVWNNITCIQKELKKGISHSLVIKSNMNKQVYLGSVVSLLMTSTKWKN